VNTEKLLKEMIDIVLRKKPSKETELFAEVELEDLVIYQGCVRILEWFRIQSVALRKKPLKLKTTSSVDRACLSLIETADFFKEIVQVKDNVLIFSENISLEQAQEMMLYAKKNYNPPILR
jgi:hypothetical protein